MLNQQRLRPERGAKPPSESERGWGPASTDFDTIVSHATDRRTSE
jgi:hypothetical protein